MIYFSQNPIETTVTGLASGYKVELKLFAENSLYDGLTQALGTFQFTASGATMSQRVDSIIDSWLMSRIHTTFPTALDASIGAEVNRRLSTRFRVDHRIDSGSGFSAWVSGSVHYAIAGGQPWEEFDDSFKTNASNQITWLNPGVIASASRLAPSFLYFLIPAAATVTYYSIFYTLDGTAINQALDTITTPQAFEIIQLPVVFPPENYAPKFKMFVQAPGLDPITVDVFVNKAIRKKYAIQWFNGSGAWSSFDCHNQMSKGLEVSQSVAESFTAADYFNTSLAQFQVYNSSGRKKHKLSFGFSIATNVETIIQDFLLSPHRHIWHETLERWIPITVSTKSLEYAADNEFIRTVSFEFQYAFETNKPSQI
jgi:hypothetical protein